MGYRKADGVVEALELEDGEASGRPGTRVRDVEVVPARHGGEPGGGVPGHGAPECGRRPVEFAGLGDLVQPRPCHLNPTGKQSIRIQESHATPAQRSNRAFRDLCSLDEIKRASGYLDSRAGGGAGGGEGGERPGGEEAAGQVEVRGESGDSEHATARVTDGAGKKLCWQGYYTCACRGNVQLARRTSAEY